MIVFPDTNVLYPIRLADLILRAVEFHLIDLAWTDELLTEIECVLVEKKKIPQASAIKFVNEVRETAPDGRIDPSHYQYLIVSMTGRDPKDHVHAAAARGGFVDVLLTSNIVDFPREDVGSNCRVMLPDELFAELANNFPFELTRIVTEMALHMRRPSMSVRQVLDGLKEIGLTKFVSTINEYVN